MRPAVREAFVAFTAPLEGVVPYLYADIKGLVTIAIGNLVDPVDHALPLPLYTPDGRPATSEEIRAEWTRVKNDTAAARLGHRYAREITKLRLTEAGVSKVVLGKLDQVDAQMRSRFADWESWPADAQLGALSMAWACGAGFVRIFPRLAKALDVGDFAAAARECHINETGNPGIKPRNVANKTLFRNASRAADPSLLAWPDELLEAEPPSTVPELVQPRNPDTATAGIVDAAIAAYQHERDGG